MKNHSFFLAVIFALASCLNFAAPANAQETLEMMDMADEYGEMAFDVMRAGDFDKGLKLLNLATKTNPYDPKWHMHYSTVLSKRATAYLKAGARRRARSMFRVVEKELLMATKIFLDRGDKANAAHTYHQIGQINQNIFHRRGIAAGYYQRALDLQPGHGPAAVALKSMGAR